VFYNGSKFDFYFFYNMLTRLYPHLIDSKGTSWKGSALIRFTIRHPKGTGVGNIHFYDLYRHLAPYSLSAALKSYGCEVSKGDFDHKLIKNKFAVILHKEGDHGWRSYLHKDVKGLCELFLKYHKAIWDSSKVSILRSGTAPSLAVRIHKQTLPVAELHIPDIEEDLYFRRALYGGCTQIARMKFDGNPEDPNDRLIYLDVNSLYPTAMKESLFPTGKSVLTIDPDQTEGLRENMNMMYKQGYDRVTSFNTQPMFIECDVEIPNDLLFNPLPRKYVEVPVIKSFDDVNYMKKKAQFGLGWGDLSSIIKNVYYVTQLQFTLSLGCTITKIHSIHTFEGEVTHLFKEHIENQMRNKVSAEELKSEAGELIRPKNPALRNEANPIMNSTYANGIGNLAGDYDQKSRLIYFHMINKSIAVQLEKQIKDTEIVYPTYAAAITLANSKCILGKHINLVDGF